MVWLVASVCIAQDAPDAPRSAPRSRQELLLEQASVFAQTAFLVFRGASFTTACRAARSPAERNAVRSMALERLSRVQDGLVRVEAAARLGESIDVARLHTVLLTQWERPMVGCQSERRDQDALDALMAWKALAQEITPTLAFREALLRSRTGDHLGAARVYEQAIEEMENVDEAAPFFGNMAESLMLAGELERAADHYARAKTLADHRGDALSSRLASWGRALALARHGNTNESLAAMREALGPEGSLQALREDDVSFEPPGELLAYEALAHETRGLDGAPLLDTPTFVRPHARAWLDAIGRATPAQAAQLSCALGRSLQGSNEETLTPPPSNASSQRGGEPAAVRNHAWMSTAAAAMTWHWARTTSTRMQQFDDFARTHEDGAITRLVAHCDARR